MPLFFVAVVLACGVLWIHSTYGRVMIDVGGQGRLSSFCGTEYRARDLSSFVVPMELQAAVFFVLIALVFVGLGQVMGREFSAARDRLRAYVSNILGSRAGVAVFALASGALSRCQSKHSAPSRW